MSARPKILLLGKLPPPYMGPALATQILLRSDLVNRYELGHVDSNVHDAVESVGKAELRTIMKHIRVYRALLACLRSGRPELVVIPISQSTVGFLKDSVFILMARLFGCPVLVQLRGGNLKNWLRGASAPVRAYVRAVLRQSAGAIVLGQSLRGQFAGILPDSKIFVVPNGADYPTSEKTVRSDSVGLLYLSNLQPSKGIEDVIAAVELLKEWGTRGFRLDVVGAWRDDETRRRCRERVEAGGLPVVFHGPAYGEEKQRFLAQADVFVFTPRLPEGHPWVIVEALAAGLPIVTTDQGAIRECVVDGVNGHIVGSEAPFELAEKMRDLVENPRSRAAQSESSRRRYEQNFTESHMVDQFSRAIDGVLAA